MAEGRICRPRSGLSLSDTLPSYRKIVRIQPEYRATVLYITIAKTPGIFNHHPFPEMIGFIMFHHPQIGIDHLRKFLPVKIFTLCFLHGKHGRAEILFYAVIHIRPVRFNKRTGK